MYNKEACKRYRENNRKARAESQKRYALNNIEKIKNYRSDYYLEHKEEKAEYTHNHYLENKEKRDRQIKDWKIKNKKRVKELRDKNKSKRNLQEKQRRATDIDYKIRTILRTRLRHALNGETKSAHTLELLGCSIEELRSHLEKQFTKRMNWSNHAPKGWHIDHIIPCASFDLSKESEQFKCFNYKNLRPLWFTDNLSRPKPKRIITKE